MPSHLSKSDFKVARDCPAKLYYRKLGYPSAKDHDYSHFLKDGGYMVETLAKLLHPEGVEIGFEGGLEEAAAKTMRALRKENATLFEATLVWDQYCARVDILKKVGNRFELIEVKAKSVSSSDGQPFFRGKRGELSPVGFRIWKMLRTRPIYFGHSSREPKLCRFFDWLIRIGKKCNCVPPGAVEEIPCSMSVGLFGEGLPLE